MSLTFLTLTDILGTIAFAISGAIVAGRHKLDIFGFNFLAVVTATGGGFIRDLVIGKTPPTMFSDPKYVIIAIICANIVFVIMKIMQRHSENPKALTLAYEWVIFAFDTIGLASFTMNPILIGIHSGYEDHFFLLVFLGVITAVGGGLLRDIFCNQIPEILQKKIYALASILGAICALLIFHFTNNITIATACCFISIIALRFLAAHFRWNLPRL